MSENKNDLQKPSGMPVYLLLMQLSRQNDANLQKGKFCKEVIQSEFDHFQELQVKLMHKGLFAVLCYFPRQRDAA